MKQGKTYGNFCTPHRGIPFYSRFFSLFSQKKHIGESPKTPMFSTCSAGFTTFTFTGKARDEETGYGYFGARYMDHELMTMWLSVDPMADKYPSISPYAYCAWNPVKLVDPDGKEMDDYVLNTKTGSLIKTNITTDNNDIIFVDNNPNQAFVVDKGVLNGKIGEDLSTKGFDADNGRQSQGISLMYFISTNSHIELSGWGYKDQYGKEGIYVEAWHKNTGTSCVINDFTARTPKNKRTKQFNLHIHPGLRNGMGGFGRPSKKDYIASEKYKGPFYIISTRDGLTQFSSNKGKRKYWHPSKQRVPKSLKQFIKQ